MLSCNFLHRIQFYRIVVSHSERCNGVVTPYMYLGAIISLDVDLVSAMEKLTKKFKHSKN